MISSKDLMAKLKELVVGIVTDPDKLDRFKKAWRGGFHQYSLYNTLLILWQYPKSTICAGFSKWRSLGRFVKKGENAIWILAPNIIKESVKEVVVAPDGSKVEVETGKYQDRLIGFKQVYVFDYNQTDGKELSLGNKLVNGKSKFSLDSIKAAFPEIIINVTQGIEDGKVYRKASPDNPDQVFVDVSQRENKSQEVASLIHELAHYVLGHLNDMDNDKLSRNIKEVEAEAVSYIVCSMIDIDNEGAKYYVGCWGGKEDIIKNQSLRIMKASERILKRIEPEMFKKLGEDMIN